MINETLKVLEGGATFDDWLNKEFLSTETREQIKSANVLLVPIEGFRNRTENLFHSGTEEMFTFLREKAPENVHVDIAINEQEYREIALHADEFRLGMFLVEAIVAPVFTILVASWIDRKLQKRKDDTNVHFTMTIVNKESKTSTTLDYNGPADTFERTMKDGVQKVLEGQSSARKE